MVDWAVNTGLSLHGLELMQEPSNLLVVGSIPTEGATQTFLVIACVDAFCFRFLQFALVYLRLADLQALGRY